MDWPQHGRTVESSRCISGGPCHLHGEAGEILTEGEWHHSYQGHSSVQGVEGGAEKGRAHQGKAGVSLGIKQK